MKVVTANINDEGAKDCVCEAWRDRHSVGATLVLDQFIELLGDEVGSPTFMFTLDELKRKLHLASDVVVQKMRKVTEKVS